MPAPLRSFRKVEVLIITLSDLGALLPELVTWMSCVLSCEGTVQTRAVNEGLLIDPLVDAGTTFGAFEVAFGLLKAVLILVWCSYLLVVQDVLDGLDPCGLLVRLGCFGSWGLDMLGLCGAVCIVLQVCPRGPVWSDPQHPCPACSAVVPAAMWFPSVVVGFPLGFRLPRWQLVGCLLDEVSNGLAALES